MQRRLKITTVSRYKKIIPIGPLLLIFLCPLWGMAQSFTQEEFQWSQLPELPPAPGQTQQAGLAGAFSGVHHNALIIAGGANFPDAAPWEGGTKVWWDDIYVLEKTAGGAYQWHTDPQFKLPVPLAYGVSVSTDEGLLCVGGNNEKEVSDKVYLLSWNPAAKQISVEEKPSMPVPLSMMAGAKVNQTVYLAGGQETNVSAATKTFLSLSLDDFTWQTLPAWPGPPRVVPVAASQSNGLNDCFYLFSGRNPGPDQRTEILTDAYRYNPADNQWTKISDVSPSGTLPAGRQVPPSDVMSQEDKPVAVMAGTAVASGANHILVFGGADGRIFRQLEDLDQQIAEAKDTATAASFIRQKLAVHTTHPGFSRDILSYNTVTDTWNHIGKLPEGSQVTTNAIRWNEAIVIPSGEIRPGVRTPTIRKATVVVTHAFGWLNYSVVAIYLLLLVGMGMYFSRREDSTDDYFKAGGRVPWWAAGLSIFGTQLSAITFMAVPAKSFATDWAMFLFNLTIIMVAPLIVYVFLPFYRRLNITTAYEYLEKRFNVASRLIGGLMFIALQFGRIGIVLFLPSIALSVVTGIDVSVCILLMGVLSIVYTVLGGIEAVIWTDVLQVVVLLGGALLCLVMIPMEVEGGFSAVMNIAISNNKFHIFNFDIDLTSPTFWVVVFGGIGANIISYGSDQTVVQRFLTTKDEKSAADSIWTSALLVIPASILFFGIGTALYAFYQLYPNLMNAVSLDNADAILPYYIVTQLPQGVAGLLIAGIFAAAMSSLDSSMNSIATVITTDFYQRFSPDATERSSLRIAKWTTAIVGVSGTAFALLMATWDIKSLWDQLNTFIGLFAGGLGGLFLLGMFTRKTNGVGAVVGLVASAVVQLVVKAYTPISFLLYTFTGIVSCIVIGYIVSLLVKQPPKDLNRLTIHSIHRKTEPETVS